MPEWFRALFPSLETRVHLACCSHAPRSAPMKAAMELMLDDLERDQPWPLFETKLVELRGLLAELLGCVPRQLSLQPNASIAAFQVASSMDWRQRPRIVTCRAEFPSLAQVWKAQEQRGAELLLLDAPVDADALLQAYGQAIDERVGLVSVPALDFVGGTRLPVREIAALAHRQGARVFCDAYQLIGTEPVDAVGLDLDYLVGGTMKYLLGLPGQAFLYARQPVDVQRCSLLTGWQGRRDPFAFDPLALDHPIDSARRFETGTPAIAPAYAAVAGLGVLLDLGLQRIALRIAELKTLASVCLAALDMERLLVAPPAACGAHIALRLDDASRALALEQHLREHHIQVSPRREALRLAFHAYNEVEDIDRLSEALCAARARGLVPPYRARAAQRAQKAHKA